MIHELCEFQASSGLGQVIARDRSSPGQAWWTDHLWHRPKISANKELANVKPSPVVFDVLYIFGKESIRPQHLTTPEISKVSFDNVR